MCVLACVLSGTVPPWVHAESVCTNLVVNGGFETGSFAGWTQFNPGAFVGVTNDPLYVQSGSQGAFFGSPNAVSGIFQTLATTVGASYQVSFWLGNLSSNPISSMAFNWDGGANELSFVNSAAFGYTNFTYLLTATSAATDLRFSFRHDLFFWAFDTVSVVQVPEPGSLALVGLALVGLTLSARRKQA